MLSRCNQPRPTAARTGAAVVEFAVIAPLLLLLSLGMIEVTRAAQVKMTLGDAVRNGARIGIQPNQANADVQTAVEDVLKQNGIDVANATITIEVKKDDKSPWKKAEVGTAERGAWVKVSVQLALTDVGWVAPMMFSGGARQTESLVMLRQ